jgi:hypothetical protein
MGLKCAPRNSYYTHVMKIDDLIAIFGPINCALYRDKIDQFDEL